MPPARMRSIDLGVPTPGQTQDDESTSSAGLSKLDAMLNKERARQKRQINEQQQAILDQATRTAKGYRDAVAHVIREGEVEMTKRIEQHRIEDKRLRDELARTEQTLIEMLQSDAKLFAAAMSAAVEENELARASVIDSLQQFCTQQQQEGQAALDDLWVTDDEVEREDDDPGGSISA